MENKSKMILIAVVAAILVAVIIIFATASKSKRNDVTPVPTETPTATPTPSPVPEITPTVTPEPTPDDEVIPTDTEEPEVVKELTEEEKLMNLLLSDPFGTTGADPAKSLTMTSHAEQSMNLNEENTLFIDVTERLKEQGVSYIPFSSTYDSEKEYIENGYRSWMKYDSTEDKTTGGSAEIYNLKEGTIHSYGFIANYGCYEDEGFVKTDSLNEENTHPWPKYNFVKMFAENLPPVLTETDDEYIIDGFTTSEGFNANSEYTMFLVTINPTWNFQYLIGITLRYDKETLRLKTFDAEVKGKVSRNPGWVSDNDPTAERIISENGITSATLHVEFTKYNATTLTKLDGKVFTEPFIKNQEVKKEPAYAYTYADGSVHYFTIKEWDEAIISFTEAKEGEGGYSDFIKEMTSIQSPYIGTYVLFEDVEPEKRGDKYRSDKAWSDALAEWKQRAKEELEKPVSERLTSGELLGEYKNTFFPGCYRTPMSGYLCSMLLDKDGKIKKEFTSDEYTANDYAYLLEASTRVLNEYLGKEFGYNYGKSKLVGLQRLVNEGPEDSQKIWEYITTITNDLDRMSEYYPGGLALQTKHLNTVIDMVKNDIRNRFETKLKAWVTKKHIGSVTNPNV